MKLLVTLALLTGCRGILGIDDPVIDNGTGPDGSTGSDGSVPTDTPAATPCLDKWRAHTVQLTTPTVVFTSSQGVPGTPWVSPDEMEMWFTDAVGSGAPLSIYRATRTSTTAAFSGATQRTDLNTGGMDDDDVTLSGDRLIAIYSTEDGPTATTPDSTIATRTSTSANFGTPTTTGLGNVNSSDPEVYVALTSDGLHLYFSRFSGMTTTVFVSSRSTTSEAFGPPVALGGLLTDDAEASPSADQTIVLFTRDIGTEQNPMVRLFYATRPSPTAALTAATQLGVTAGAFDVEPFLTNDACAVYWASVDTIVMSRVIL